jgi:hypothetical protein
MKDELTAKMHAEFEIDEETRANASKKESI